MIINVSKEKIVLNILAIMLIFCTGTVPIMYPSNEYINTIRFGILILIAFYCLTKTSHTINGLRTLKTQ
jgi:hypothetical protein